jgi:trk system potassium uptake protein TrkH
MNFRNVIFILSRLASVESIFIIISALVAFYYGQDDFIPLLLTGSITFILGLFFSYIFRKGKGDFGIKEGYITVTFAWIIFSLIGAIPFYISGYIPFFTDAFFEAMSGFTTTGVSILNNIETLPHGLLLWRSLTQWLGGLGIIVLSLAVLPVLGVGGMQFFLSEIPGLSKDKLHPRIKETVKKLWWLYMGYTVLETILLYYGGMNLFDAVCHSFTTISTGGFSTRQANIAYYNSPFIQYVIIVFMFIGGINFPLSFNVLRLRLKKLFRSEEFKLYVLLIIIVTVSITIVLFFISGKVNLEKNFRNVLFQVVSLITTTGFVSENYMQWPSYIIMILVVLMFIGGMAGSTAGGIKVARVLIVIKNSLLEFKRLIHSAAVIPIKFNGRTVNEIIVRNILAFVVSYLVIFVISTVLVSAMGYDLETSIGAVAATINNVGPGIGGVGPMGNFSHFPDIGKWLLSFLMLIGRLELFTVLVLFSKSYWKN